MDPVGYAMSLAADADDVLGRLDAAVSEASFITGASIAVDGGKLAK